MAYRFVRGWVLSTYRVLGEGRGPFWLVGFICHLQWSHFCWPLSRLFFKHPKKEVYLGDSMWPTFIGYGSLTLAKNHGMKCDAIGNILGNTLGTSEEPTSRKINPPPPPPFPQAKLWKVGISLYQWRSPTFMPFMLKGYQIHSPSFFPTRVLNV